MRSTWDLTVEGDQHIWDLTPDQRLYIAELVANGFSSGDLDIEVKA